MFKLKFNLESHLKQKGFTFPGCDDPLNPSLTQDQKISLYHAALDILFKTDKLHTVPSSPTAAAGAFHNSKKDDFLQGRSASQIQNEAVRRA